MIFNIWTLWTCGLWLLMMGKRPKIPTNLSHVPVSFRLFFRLKVYIEKNHLSLLYPKGNRDLRSLDISACCRVPRVSVIVDLHRRHTHNLIVWTIRFGESPNVRIEEANCAHTRNNVWQQLNAMRLHTTHVLLNIVKQLWMPQMPLEHEVLMNFLICIATRAEYISRHVCVCAVGCSFNADETRFNLRPLLPHENYYLFTDCHSWHDIFPLPQPSREATFSFYFSVVNRYKNKCRIINYSRKWLITPSKNRITTVSFNVALSLSLSLLKPTCTSRFLDLVFVFSRECRSVQNAVHPSFAGTVHGVQISFPFTIELESVVK